MIRQVFTWGLISGSVLLILKILILTSFINPASQQLINLIIGSICIMAGMYLGFFWKKIKESNDSSFKKGSPKNLSQKEMEILLSLAKGNSNAQIAKELFVSENTVKTHLKNLYEKLSVRNRTQALISARKEGILIDKL